MGKLSIFLLIVAAIITIARTQSISSQAKASRQKCENGLRAKGCTGISSTCDVKKLYFSCKCKARSCPIRGKRAAFSNAQRKSIKAKKAFRTSGCDGRRGGVSCPTGWCCGPASLGSPLNMRICYPPGSPC